MKRAATSLVLLLLVSLPPHAATPPAPVNLDRLTWLLGEWVVDRPDQQTFERWSRVGEDVFRGAGGSRQVSDGSERIVETLHLLHIDGEIFYLAKVDENTLPVAFRLTGLTGISAVFENPEHDFPTRLEYVRDGDNAVTVHVSGPDGDGFSLAFERAPATSLAVP